MLAYLLTVDKFIEYSQHF